MLRLADGSVWKGLAQHTGPLAASGLGRGPLAASGLGKGHGEVVFFTGMTGYEEALTDPSYAGQILVFTFPSVGIYGWSWDRAESPKIWVQGVVVRTMEPDLFDFLIDRGIPVLTGVDTRSLVLHLREHSTIFGSFIDSSLQNPCETPPAYQDSPTYQDWMTSVVSQVSCYGVEDSSTPDSTKKIVAIVDLGMKRSQLQCLSQVFGKVYHLKVVPYNVDLVGLASSCDLGGNPQLKGVFLSNGPGNPEDLEATTIANLRQFMDSHPTIPVFGICLGHQVLALAAGATTYKLPYGNRGVNIPVGFDERLDSKVLDTNFAYITSQNHGYAVDDNSLDKSLWRPLFVNLNDQSNEGILSPWHPWFSVQFHPEARGGPEDTRWLFDVFSRLVKSDGTLSPLQAIEEFVGASHHGHPSPPIPKRKVLILGSGGLSIGQAGEFDYSGSQAIKAYKAQGMTTVILNPNIATIQTTADGHLADKVYSLPVTPEWVAQVIEQESPDCIAVSFGGQTALNCAVALEGEPCMDGVHVLGTPLAAIKATEDREAFKAIVDSVGAACAPSISFDLNDASFDPYAAAESLGYPVLVRSGFALGGLGSGFASNGDELKTLLASNTTSTSMIMDKSLKGWIEVEFEIVRDAYGNAITVCSMENFDPVGVHTGESIVVAPCLTLDDQTIQTLRSLALRMAHAIGIVGECNIQYAINPSDFSQVYIIEVNARLSRSSALASKATGYPLAYVAALLGLGASLPSLTNTITGTTTAMFEPSLDYCVAKMPRWDLAKFEHAEATIGTAMKSVGEVMAIGATFEEALMKAVRMVEDGPSSTDDLGWFSSATPSIQPGPRQVQRLMANLAQGRPLDSKISPYFLNCLCRIGKVLDRLKTEPLTHDLILKAKRVGLSDSQIAFANGTTEAKVTKVREDLEIFPSLFEVDTVAGEFSCQTPYLYLTYHGDTAQSAKEAEPLTLVLGSGTYRIGSSVEFDWCAVNCVRELRDKKLRSLRSGSIGMLNFNPETVSTDFDEADVLVFDEISLETVAALARHYTLQGLVVSVGGQTPNNLAQALYKKGYPVVGTHPEQIDQAEDRFKFSRLLEAIGVDQPEWFQLTSVEEAFDFAERVGYPVLVRPSYVLSGAAMKVVFGPEELEEVISRAAEVSKDKPVVISKFLQNAKEIEVDAVAHKGKVIHLAISEHVENAGVHSGDATLIFPPKDLTAETLAKVEASTRAIGDALSISGPFNIQFVAKDDAIRVIECNLRASRSFPFVSKVSGINLIREATKAMVNSIDFKDPLDLSSIQGRGVKVPVFSFRRLPGADCVLGVEMRSTGEVACMGGSVDEAYLKALEASTLPIRPLFTKAKPSILLSIGSHANKVEMEDTVKALVAKGFVLSGTPGTASFYNELFTSQAIQRVGWSALDTHLDTCDFVLNVSMLDRAKLTTERLSQGYHLRRLCIQKGKGILTDIKAAKAFVKALLTYHPSPPSLNPLLDCQTPYTTCRLPGLIDVHVHIREPGDTYKGDWESETLAALHGGVTTVLVMPNTKPPITNPVNLQLIVDAALSKSRCDWGVYLGGAKDNQDDILAMLNGPHKDRIAGMKLYLDETFSGSLDMGHEWDAVAKHFASWAAHGVTKPIVVHTEADNFMRVLGLMAIYPSVRVHVAHVHSRRLLDLVKGAKAQGMRLTCEATPHHLFMDGPVEIESCCVSEGGTCHSTTITRFVKPPIGGDAAYLREHLDVFDCFATDHAPHLESEKGCPGYPGLETCVALLLQLPDGLALLKEKMYDNPCRIFGLKPTPAEITLRTDYSWTFDVGEAKSRCGWSPFDGQEMRGKVTGVTFDNQTLMMDGQLKDMGPLSSWMDDRPIFKDYPSSFDATSGHEPTIINKEATREPVIHEPAIADRHLRANPLSLRPFGITSVLTAKAFDKPSLRALFDRATYLRAMDLKGTLPQTLAGKALTLLFMEPSTRTSLSFQRAATKMGASVQVVTPSTSSLTKGESLPDTLRCLAISSDAIVLRGPSGCIAEAKPLVEDGTLKCLISGGDGTKEHPTQALLDVYTIREELGSLHGLTITLVGDMRHGRTIPSLLHLLCLYRVKQVYCVAPYDLNLTEEFVATLQGRGLPLTLTSSLDDVLSASDVVYMTRLQKERMGRMNYSPYVLDPALLAKAKREMIVMHPLPRNDEISTEVDSDPRAVYFRQMVHGLYLRMALLEGLMVN